MIGRALNWVIAGEAVLLSGHLWGWRGTLVSAALAAAAWWLRLRPSGIWIGVLIGALSVCGSPFMAPSGWSSGSVSGMVAGDPFAGACAPVVTQPYGPTSVGGEPIVNGVRIHTGIDLACPKGTPVRSVTAGTAHVQTSGSGVGFGNNVVVAAGDTFVRYGHLDSTAVADGQSVRVGELLGFEGSTGFSTGPHLHFEVDQGAADVQHSVDPAPWLSVSR